MTEEHGPAGASPNDAPAIHLYTELKRRLLGCIDTMKDLDEVCKYPQCSELGEKLESNGFNLLVVGQFKRGKTCLINALLGADILPVAVVPLTSIVTILEYGETVRLRAFFNDGTVTDIHPEALGDYVTEVGNPNNVKEVKEVVISYPSPYLKDGVRLIDTPGVGSIYLHNTDVSYQYLPKSDAALFLLSVDQPVSRAELDFLKDVRQYADRVFFLLNKIDYLSEAEISQSMAFSSKALQEAMGAEVRMFPVSAQLALQGQLQGSRELMQRSRLPVFSEALSRFLLHEKGKVLLISVANNLLRILAQYRLELELEEKALTTPVEELKGKIKEFTSKEKKILQERKRVEDALDSEVSRLVKTSLEPDLLTFKASFTEQMEHALDAFYDQHRELSLKELNDALETYIATEVRQAFNAWRNVEEEKLASAFQSLCTELSSQMNDIVDELLAFSSQLFNVQFEAVQAESLWTGASGFHYKLRDEPVGLDLVGSSITQVLPGYIGDRFARLKAYVIRMANKMIFSKRKQHMLELIEMQSGRVRHDFVERIQLGKRRFRKQMLEKAEITVGGIRQALEKGMDDREKSEREAEEQRGVLSMRLAGVQKVQQELMSIKAAAENV